MVWVLFAAAMAQAPNVDALDTFLTEQAAAGQFVGAVAVLDGDQVLLHQSYGDVPDNPLCRIGSVTKSFTAATVYALQDAGMLSVDDAVGTWLPTVHDAVGDGPTLRQLMTHRGGLSELVFNPWVRPPQWDDLKPMVRAELTQEVPPGEREEYSNTGFLLLAATIEAASGLSYEDAVKQHVLAPLNLPDTRITGVDDDRLLSGRIPTAVGLVDSQRALPRLMPYDGRYPIGGQGALVSSPVELARYTRGLASGRILSDGARAELIRAADGSDMAAGWVRDDDVVWHNGALEPLGIYAYVRWSTSNDVAVAVCGSPSVSSLRPELRVPVEQALAGETTDVVEVSSGPLGWVALVSTLCLHWGVGVLGLLLSLLGTSKIGRVGTAFWSASVVLACFGLTHAGLGLGMAAVVLVLSGVRGWRATERERGGLLAILGVVSGALALAGSSVFVGLLALMTYLTNNLWSLMAAGA